MKVVCDTNIIVSGILFGGNARRILALIAQGRLTNYTTTVMIGELQDVLGRPKFHLKPDQIAAALNLVRDTFHLVIPARHVSSILADPDDDRILEAGDAAEAEFIITGDRHLLDLKVWEGIKIIKPVDFLISHLF